MDAGIERPGDVLVYWSVNTTVKVNVKQKELYHPTGDKCRDELWVDHPRTFQYTTVTVLNLIKSNKVYLGFF